MKHQFMILAATSILVIPGQLVLAEGDLADTLQMCADCHGENGVSTESDVPTIAGISAFALEDYLLVYQDRARPCVETKFRDGDLERPATDMCQIADDLSEAQIRQLAEHYSSQQWVAAKQDFDAALAAQGESIHDRECEKCHSDDGSYADDDTSILAGQWMPYLEQSIRHYKSGEREAEDKMLDKLEKLDESDIEALLHFYGSKQ